MKLMLPPSVKNWLSLAGVIIALTSLFMIIFLFIVTSIITEQAAYLGLVTYILLPAVMVIGLLLIPVGMVLKIRRAREEGALPSPGWPKIDLEEPHTRHAFFIFVIGTAFFLAYLGSRQLRGLPLHRIDRISAARSAIRSCSPNMTRTPLRLMRRCPAPHAMWDRAPTGMSAQNFPVSTRYMPSSLMSIRGPFPPRSRTFALPVPSANSATGRRNSTAPSCGRLLTTCRTGITPPGACSRAEDRPTAGSARAERGDSLAHQPQCAHRLLRSTSPGSRFLGSARPISIPGKQPFSSTKPCRRRTGPVPRRHARTMDCMDCHNRPSHQYRAPVQFINTALTVGRIPAALPEIKKLAVELCSSEYESAEAARKAIRSGIEAFYAKNYPGQPPGLVEKGVTGVLEAFAQNVFPYMKARWSAYPDNIGHIYFEGCFRCHDGNHVSASGETTRKDCNLCHDILVQGRPGKDLEMARLGESLQFRHPEDIGDAWKDTPCTDCHAGKGP